jgi:hypothetical protein
MVPGGATGTTGLRDLNTTASQKEAGPVLGTAKGKGAVHVTFLAKANEGISARKASGQVTHYFC